MSNNACVSSRPGRSLGSYLQVFGVPLLLGFVCFFVYNANLRQIGAGDTLPARYLPLILWHDGTFDLHANSHLVAHGHPRPTERNRPADAADKVRYFEPRVYWMVRTRQHQLASLYPIVTPVLVAPLYLPAVLWLNAHGWEQPQIGRVAELMEKIAASVIASVASVIMLLVLRRDGGRWSLPLAAVFAFGTNTWMISSQALWQHGTGELLIALALLLVIIPASPVRMALLGGVCVLMAANRPPDALVAGAFILFAIWHRRRNALWLFAGAAAPLAALLYYHLDYIGHIAGGYVLVKPPRDFFQHDWSGVPGLLVSPTRGLLVFTPFLIFVPIGLIQRLRSPESSGLAVALSIAVVAQIIGYAQGDWRGGAAWGPRWLTNILPILMWMLAPAPLILRPFVRSLLILTMVASVGVQAIGAFWYTKISDERIFAGDSSSIHAAWDLENIPFVVELRHPPARGDLQCDAQGSIDRVGAILRPGPADTPALEHGAPIEGWALTCGRTPARLLILIDGIVIGSTVDFLPRVDVNEVMRTSALSGWRIEANTWGVPPGEHVLQLAVRIEPRSNLRIVREQRVFVIAHEPAITAVEPLQQPVSGADLDAMAERAVSLLRNRQDERGYWLTAHTQTIRYEAPRPEMNTFLTSMLVDLLAPIAQQRGLADTVERAAEHLVAQIESNGLVRYHGLPDGPTIGTLGCAITPDSDDTALVWKIAGRSMADPRQHHMLEVLAQYRDVRGLYYTWLAPQQQYQCIDPGHDPNPTDITIQMHVYLMLHEFDPPAAQNLCSALQRSFRDEDIWVYYAKSPLIPYLRSAELQQLGCNIPLPTERLALPAADQEIWSEAAHLLVTAASMPHDTNTQEAIRNLLVRIGSDDFALLRGAPPLLYHNDLSATVRRYYWSEDFGYALWLRLYEVSGVEAGHLYQPSR
ncbi:MAG TPA: hypothetical protein PKA05_11865 [Roseiflexaceae bacterium]|nr:hypothetical protein [Roseiflexaceae bacterium]